MVILTDGDIHDMPLTKDTIVELSKYPVSLIIIGVGTDDFDKMRELDSDDRIMRSSKGVAAQRDIVQFVRFKDYERANFALLAEEVLREMPDQIVGYMLANNIKPQK